MGYTLGQAKTDLKRSLLWNEQAISRAPLAGDPYGKTFYTEIYPIVAGSLSASTLFYADNTTASALFVSADAETGLVLTSASPSQGLLASFRVSELSDSQLTGIVQAGLDYLESAYPRGFSFSSASTPDASVIVDSDGNDPTLGSGTLFSQSRGQIGLYLQSCQIKLAEALHQYAATHAFSYRGAGGGILVDKSRQPEQMRKLVEDLKKDFTKSLEAQGDDSGDGASFIPNLLTYDYWHNYNWQSGAANSTENALRGVNG